MRSLQGRPAINIALQQFGSNPALLNKAGREPGMSQMDLSLTAANLSFLLCGIIVMLATLLVWAILSADRWVVLQRPARIRSNREQSGT